MSASKWDTCPDLLPRLPRLPRPPHLPEGTLTRQQDFLVLFVLAAGPGPEGGVAWSL